VSGSRRRPAAGRTPTSAGRNAGPGWDETPPKWDETPGGWDDTRGSWALPAVDWDREAENWQRSAAGRDDGGAPAAEPPRRPDPVRPPEPRREEAPRAPQGQPRRPAGHRRPEDQPGRWDSSPATGPDVAGRWRRPPAGWRPEPGQQRRDLTPPQYRPSRDARRPPSAPPRDPHRPPPGPALDPRRHSGPPRDPRHPGGQPAGPRHQAPPPAGPRGYPGPGAARPQHPDPSSWDPQWQAAQAQAAPPTAPPGARPPRSRPAGPGPDQAEWERDPESWYRPAGPPVRHHDEPPSWDPGVAAPPQQYQPRPDTYPPPQRQSPEPRPDHPATPEPYPHPPRRKAAPGRPPGGPAGPGGKGQPARRPPKKNQHPWGMMIFLSVGLTLATYGLVKFGYGQTTGYVLGPCSGAAPSISLSHTFGNQSIGVATKYAYQYREHSFSKVLQRTPAMAEFYEPFPATSGFQSNVACFFAKRGIMSLIQLDPTSNVSLSAIAHGDYDGYLRGYAAAVKQFHAPIALSFGHEMNGWWYPWGLHENSPPAQFTSKPKDFIAAWRHIHAVFTKAGATNVKWVWTVRQNVGELHGKKWPGIKAWWPGGKYVDWVGMDGYFRRESQDFNSVFGTQVTDIRAITGKPLLIGETAVQMQNPNATKQISELFDGVRRTPKMLGFIWFDLDSTRSAIHWNIDNNATAISAIRQELHQPPPSPKPKPGRSS
jgi:glycosyl hydrolase family 26